MNNQLATYSNLTDELLDQPNETVALTHSELETKRKNLPMVRVLVVEDSETQVMLIRQLLTEAKDSRFEIVVESDLESGLNRLSNDNFDAVLLDLTLGDSTGIETCQRACQAVPSVPIVVLTGSDDEATAVAAQQQGAADYLVKGQIGSDLLARSIRYAIARKKSELDLQQAHDELEQRVEERTAELKRMQAEAVLRKEELAHAARLNSLGELASGLAHELNQPLMAIIGFTDHSLNAIESETYDLERMTEMLTDTSREAKRAGEIIKRMRRLVSKRIGKRELTNLNQAVEESVQLLNPGLNTKVTLDLESSLPDVLVDRVQVQQVIINLAQNAVQAMGDSESNSHELKIRSGKLDDEFLFLEFVDNGPGISSEDLNRLFEPFFTRNKPDGLGLGLSITQTIVESHGGQLSANQNEDSGLTLRFTLPLAAVEQAV